MLTNAHVYLHLTTHTHATVKAVYLNCPSVWSILNVRNIKLCPTKGSLTLFITLQACYVDFQASRHYSTLALLLRSLCWWASHRFVGGRSETQINVQDWSFQIIFPHLTPAEPVLWLFSRFLLNHLDCSPLSDWSDLSRNLVIEELNIFLKIKFVVLLEPASSFFLAICLRTSSSCSSSLIFLFLS